MEDVKHRDLETTIAKHLFQDWWNDDNWDSPQPDLLSAVHALWLECSQIWIHNLKHRFDQMWIHQMWSQLQRATAQLRKGKGKGHKSGKGTKSVNKGGRKSGNKSGKKGGKKGHGNNDNESDNS